MGLRLNAPFGARCFLTEVSARVAKRESGGSSCTFWRAVHSDVQLSVRMGRFTLCGLNAPFGARCFLAPDPKPSEPPVTPES